MGGSEGYERVYDPLWSNALTLLDYLYAADLISHDIATTYIGQFVIVSGDLSVLNAAVLRETWANFRALSIKQAAEKARAKWDADPANVKLNKQARTRALDEAKANAEINFDNLKYYPHSINCEIKGNGFSVWSPLREEGITGAASDISLMHGSEVPGTWHLLGVLDALPSPIPAQETVLPSETPQHFAPTIRNFANTARTLLGRSPEAYGMTALLLFREVTSGSRGS
jgi:hypothetical protein